MAQQNFWEAGHEMATAAISRQNRDLGVGDARTRIKAIWSVPSTQQEWEAREQEFRLASCQGNVDDISRDVNKRLMKFTCVMYYQYHSKLSVSTRSILELSEDPFGKESDPHEILVAKERELRAHVVIRYVFSRLSKQDRDFLTRCIESTRDRECSDKQHAEDLGIGYSTFRQRKHRLFKKLAALAPHLREKFGDDAIDLICGG
jgi:hypothetical protein